MRSPARRGGVAGLAAALLAATACAGGLGLLGDGRLAAWQSRAEALRDLEFVRPVRLRWIESGDIPRITREEIAREYSAEYIDGYRDAYAALGVLPPGLDLLSVLLELQEDQYIGLYSAPRRTLFVLRQLPASGYDTDTVVVHELVHALQHQHFPRTIALLQALHYNDDLVMAIASAVEGDASLTMLGVADPKVPLTRASGIAGDLSRGLLAELSDPTGMLARVPNLLRTSIIFPYAYGLVVAARAWEQTGNRGLDGLLTEPPISTRDVLHPDLERPTEFVGLPLETLRAELAPRGCVVGHHNVAGTLTLRVLFEDHAGAAPAPELLRDWMGDRFAHVDCADGWGLIWVTHWSDAGAAREFAARYAEIAPSVSARSRLAGVPDPIVDGRVVRVLTPGLRDLSELLRREVETRAYSRISAWVADGCFPETPCPVE